MHGVWGFKIDGQALYSLRFKKIWQSLVIWHGHTEFTSTVANLKLNTPRPDIHQKTNIKNPKDQSFDQIKWGNIYFLTHGEQGNQKSSTQIVKILIFSADNTIKYSYKMQKITEICDVLWSILSETAMFQMNLALILLTSTLT